MLVWVSLAGLVCFVATMGIQVRDNARQARWVRVPVRQVADKSERHL